MVENRSEESRMNDKGDAEASQISGSSELRRRLSDRRIGIISLWTGIILGLLGIASGYYFYAISIQTRIPTVLIEPTRTVIVDSAAPGSSDVSILYKGEPVGPNNVTAARVYFWNAGKLSILSRDVHKTVKILFPTGVDILDATVLKASREIVNPRAQVDRNTPSAVAIKFDVLEQNDGMAIQIIYTGPRDAPITPEGLIADAPAGIRTLTAYSKPEENQLRFVLQHAARRFNEYQMLIYLVAALIVIIVVMRYLPPKGNTFRRIAKGMLPLFSIVSFWVFFFLFMSGIDQSEYQPLYDVPTGVLGNK